VLGPQGNRRLVMAFGAIHFGGRRGALSLSFSHMWGVMAMPKKRCPRGGRRRSNWVDQDSEHLPQPVKVALNTRWGAAAASGAAVGVSSWPERSATKVHSRHKRLGGFCQGSTTAEAFLSSSQKNKDRGKISMAISLAFQGQKGSGTRREQVPRRGNQKPADAVTHPCITSARMCGTKGRENAPKGTPPGGRCLRDNGLFQNKME